MDTQLAHELQEPLALRRKLDINEVNWKGVLEAYMRNTNAGFFEADQAIRKFYSTLMTPFNVYWFVQGNLTGTDALVSKAIFEVASADSVQLVFERVFTIWPARMLYTQEIGLSIEANSEKIRCQPELAIRVLGVSICLRQAWSVLLMHVAATLVAGIFLFFALILLLYGFVSFLHFLEAPLPIIKKATQEAPIGIPLLCFLVGLAGVCGRGISHLVHLLLALVKSVRNWK